MQTLFVILLKYGLTVDDLVLPRRAAGGRRVPHKGAGHDGRTTRSDGVPRNLS